MPSMIAVTAINNYISVLR